MAFILNEKVIDAEAMTADITSDTKDIAGTTGYAVHMIWTGTPTGTLQIQASNDNSDWVTVDTVSTSGAASSRLVNVTNAQYRYVRVFYDFSSGSGTLNTYISAKNI